MQLKSTEHLLRYEKIWLQKLSCWINTDFSRIITIIIIKLYWNHSLGNKKVIFILFLNCRKAMFKFARNSENAYV